MEREAIAWRRGRDRFGLVNASDRPLMRDNVRTTLDTGWYFDLATRWPVEVREGGVIDRLVTPARWAGLFVRWQASPARNACPARSVAAG
jgi:hypothetical protein